MPQEARHQLDVAVQTVERSLAAGSAHIVPPASPHTEKSVGPPGELGKLDTQSNVGTFADTASVAVEGAGDLVLNAGNGPVCQHILASAFPLQNKGAWDRVGMLLEAIDIRDDPQIACGAFCVNTDNCSNTGLTDRQ